MTTELSQAAQQQIKDHVAKKSGIVAIKVGAGMAILLFFVFFIFGAPTIVPIAGKLAFLTVLSFLAAFFASVIYANRQLVKYGIPIECAPINDDYQYVSSFDT